MYARGYDSKTGLWPNDLNTWVRKFAWRPTLLTGHHQWVWLEHYYQFETLIGLNSHYRRVTDLPEGAVLGERVE